MKRAISILVMCLMVISTMLVLLPHGTKADSVIIRPRPTEGEQVKLPGPFPNAGGVAYPIIIRNDASMSYIPYSGVWGDTGGSGWIDAGSNSHQWPPATLYSSTVGGGMYQFEATHGPSGATSLTRVYLKFDTSSLATIYTPQTTVESAVLKLQDYGTPSPTIGFADLNRQIGIYAGNWGDTFSSSSWNDYGDFICPLMFVNDSYGFSQTWHYSYSMMIPGKYINKTGDSEFVIKFINESDPGVGKSIRIDFNLPDSSDPTQAEFIPTLEVKSFDSSYTNGGYSSQGYSNNNFFYELQDFVRGGNDTGDVYKFNLSASYPTINTSAILTQQGWWHAPWETYNTLIAGSYNTTSIPGFSPVYSPPGYQINNNFFGRSGYGDYRAYVSFDTKRMAEFSAIVGVLNVTGITNITGVTLHVYVGSYYNDTEYNVSIYSSNFGNLTNNDWNDSMTWQGELLNTTTAHGTGWYDITLPESAINVGGITNLVFRSNLEGKNIGASDKRAYITMRQNSGNPTPDGMWLQVDYQQPQVVYENTNYYMEYTVIAKGRSGCEWNMTTNASWLSMTQLPTPHISGNGSCWVNGTATNDMLGKVFWVSLHTVNSKGTDDFGWTIIVAHRQPQFLNQPQTLWYNNQQYNFNGNFDSQGHGGSFYGITTNYPGDFDWNNHNGHLHIDGVTVGSYWFNISIDDNDGFWNSTNYLNWTVTFVPYHSFYELIPNFDYNTTRNSVDFTDKSSGPIVNWYWNFGDNVTSISQNPMHKYTKSGTYLVTLIVQDGSGYTAQVSHTVSINQVGGSYMFEPSNIIMPMFLILVSGAIAVSARNKFVGVAVAAFIFLVLVLWMMGQLPHLGIFG